MNNQQAESMLSGMLKESAVVQQVMQSQGLSNCAELAEALLTFLNVWEPNAGHLRLLVQLYESGCFKYWECPTCSDFCIEVNPENWDDFQGTCSQDYVSFPGGIREQCDHCRCYYPMSQQDADDSLAVADIRKRLFCEK